MKTLIKHELRQTWGILICILIASVASLSLWSNVTRAYERYIEGYQQKTDFIGLYNGSSTSYLLIMLVLILGLVYMQFKYDKSDGVGEFLATLPYTKQERHKAKLIVGIGGITSSFGLWAIIQISLWLSNKWWITDIYRFFKVAELRLAERTVTYLLMHILFLYLIIVCCYLFVYMVQFIVQPCIAAIIVSASTMLAIPYLLITVGLYIHEWTDFYWVFENVAKLLVTFIDVLETRVSEQLEAYYFIDLGLLGIRYFVLLSIIFLVGVVIFAQIKQQEGPYSKIFIPNRTLRKFFLIGTTLCGVCIPIAVALISEGDIPMVTHIPMVITGGVAYWIAYRVTKVEKG